MDIDRFKQLVSHLEHESEVSPRAYRAKVAALAILGFCILALLLATLGFGLVVLAGTAVALAVSGGAALLLLAKFGKLLLLLALPLWSLMRTALRAVSIRLPTPAGRAVTRSEAPVLFAAMDDMRRRMKGPRFHHVLIVDTVNAAVVQRPAFGLFGWPRNYLLLGLPLLECMPPEEALAVVAHEYGHLAGSHGHFSSFIYRLRHAWGSLQAYADQIQGAAARLVLPLVRWYAPYFNAYTFVLARSDEYQADAAAAALVGPAQAARALKRVNLLEPRHRRFMQQTFDRIDHDAAPPRDLMHRWAAQAGEPTDEVDARRWLGDALDREGHVTDTHPTLRARLKALAHDDAAAVLEPPPPLLGRSAAQAWLGSLVDRLRAEGQARWAEQVARPWAERHAEARQQRQRLEALRAMNDRDADREIEMLRLTMRLDPATDVREPLAAFNAAHADHPLGLFLEGSTRLQKNEREGLDLLDRAMGLDPEATKPACERAHAFLVASGEADAAETYAARWRRRDALETQRAEQLRNLDPKHALAAHGLDAETLAQVKSRLSGKTLKDVGEAYLARRVVPADPSVVQHVLGLRLGWWARRCGRQKAVIARMTALQWPLPLVFVTLDGRFAPMRAKFRALTHAKLI